MSMTAWMAFALTMSLVLTVGALLLDSGLSRLRLPTRWVWLGVLVGSLALPTAALLPAADGPNGGGPVQIEVDASAGGAVADPAEMAVTERHARMGVLLEAFDEAGLVLEWIVSAGTELLPAGPRLQRSLAGLWGAASLLLAVVFGRSMLRLARATGRLPLERLSGRDVRVSADLGPATIGLLHPEIVVPRWVRELHSEELALVVEHEDGHVRSKDPLLLALGLVPAVACPWNPLLWWQHRRLRDAVELDCDRRVLRRGVKAPRYADLLVALRSRASVLSLAVPTISGAPPLLERRLTAMKKMRFWTGVPRASLAAIAGLGLFALACTTEPPSASESRPSRSLEAEVENEVLRIRIERDGAVTLDGEFHAIDAVSEVVAERREAAEGNVIVSIEGGPDVPYQVVSRLQQEIVAGGVSRVLFFHTTEPAASGSAGADAPTPREDGLAIVLPTQMPTGVRASTQSLLYLSVLPGGSIHVRRGADPSVEQLVPTELEALWREEVAADPSLIAAVKVHPEAAYTSMVDLLDALRAAKAERISLQMLEE